MSGRRGGVGTRAAVPGRSAKTAQGLHRILMDFWRPRAQSVARAAVLWRLCTECCSRRLSAIREKCDSLPLARVLVRLERMPNALGYDNGASVAEYSSTAALTASVETH